MTPSAEAKARALAELLTEVARDGCIISQDDRLMFRAAAALLREPEALYPSGAGHRIVGPVTGCATPEHQRLLLDHFGFAAPAPSAPTTDNVALLTHLCERLYLCGTPEAMARHLDGNGVRHCLAAAALLREPELDRERLAALICEWNEGDTAHQPTEEEVSLADFILARLEGRDSK